MDKETRSFVVTIGIVIVVIAGGYTSLVAYTGMTVPFSSVVSESMQHDNERSEIGIIDTGDVVIVKSPDKAEIQSYVEGYSSGYQTFGDYGSVIIYNRDGQNPVIHRAILWLEYNGDGTWSAPALESYSGKWYTLSTDGRSYNDSDYDRLSGMLYLSVGSKTPCINLDALDTVSGYLTMGDNPVTNTNFDQSSGIVSHLISYEDIKSVPVFEIPWIGSLKLLISGSSSLDKVPNSIPSLVMVILLIFSVFLMVDIYVVTTYRRKMTESIESIKRWRKG